MFMFISVPEVIVIVLEKVNFLDQIPRCDDTKNASQYYSSSDPETYISPHSVTQDEHVAA